MGQSASMTRMMKIARTSSIHLKLDLRPTPPGSAASMPARKYEPLPNPAKSNLKRTYVAVIVSVHVVVVVSVSTSVDVKLSVIV